MTIQVEIDAFSGRPNPEFEIQGADVEQIGQKLTALPRAEQSLPELGLGFRGFILKGNPEQLGGLGNEVRVYSGLILVERGANRAAYKDVHSLEKWLRDKAAGAGFAETVR